MANTICRRSTAQIITLLVFKSSVEDKKKLFFVFKSLENSWLESLKPQTQTLQKWERERERERAVLSGYVCVLVFRVQREL